MEKIISNPNKYYYDDYEKIIKSGFIENRRKIIKQTTKSFYERQFKAHKEKYSLVLNDIKYFYFLKPENLKYTEEVLGLKLLPTENEWHDRQTSYQK